MCVGILQRMLRLPCFFLRQRILDYPLKRLRTVWPHFAKQWENFSRKREQPVVWGTNNDQVRWGEKLFYIFIKNIYSKWFLLLLSFWEVFSHYQSPKISGSVFFILQSLFLREIFNSFVEEREKKWKANN